MNLKLIPFLKIECIEFNTGSYDSKQKVVISNNYLIPKIEKTVKFKKGGYYYS